MFNVQNIQEISSLAKRTKTETAAQSSGSDSSSDNGSDDDVCRVKPKPLLTLSHCVHDLFH